MAKYAIRLVGCLWPGFKLLTKNEIVGGAKLRAHSSPLAFLFFFFSPGDSHRPSISLLFSTVSERKMARVWHALFSLALHFVSAKMSKVTQVHFHDKLCRDKSAESAAGQTSSNHETRHQKKKQQEIYISSADIKSLFFFRIA